MGPISLRSRCVDRIRKSAFLAVACASLVPPVIADLVTCFCKDPTATVTNFGASWDYMMHFYRVFWKETWKYDCDPKQPTGNSSACAMCARTILYKSTDNGIHYTAILDQAVGLHVDFCTVGNEVVYNVTVPLGPNSYYAHALLTKCKGDGVIDCNDTNFYSEKYYDDFITGPYMGMLMTPPSHSRLAEPEIDFAGLIRLFPEFSAAKHALGQVT